MKNNQHVSASIIFLLPAVLVLLGSISLIGLACKLYNWAENSETFGFRILEIKEFVTNWKANISDVIRELPRALNW